MKKIIVLLSLILVLAGYSSKTLNKEDAKTLFEKGVEGISLVQADVNMVVKSDDEEMKIDMNLRNASKVEIMSAYISMVSSELEMVYYVKDGYMYFDAFGMKMKATIDSKLDQFLDIKDMIDEYSDIDGIDFDRSHIQRVVIR